MERSRAGSASTDEALLARARAGDPDAAHVLFERHRQALEVRIRRFLPPAVQRRVSVADVLQETRILAFDRTERFEPRRAGSYRAWLLTIAERKAREALRAHAGTAKRAVGLEVTGGGRPGSREGRAKGPSPSEGAMAGELREAAARALATLTDDHREVLRLTQLQGLTLREAAAHMGRSRDAVKKLYGRALVRFAAAMAPGRRTPE